MRLCHIDPPVPYTALTTVIVGAVVHATEIVIPGDSSIGLVGGATADIRAVPSWLLTVTVTPTPPEMMMPCFPETGRE